MFLRELSQKYLSKLEHLIKETSQIYDSSTYKKVLFQGFEMMDIYTNKNKMMK